MLKNMLNKDELQKLIKFGAVGVINTLVDYAVFTLVGFLSPNVYLAQTAGYCCGVLNSYIWNRKWTFKSSGRFLGAELLKFVVVNTVTYLASLGALWLLVDNWNMNKYIAKILLIGVTLVINFTLSRLWVFREGGDGDGKGIDKVDNEE